MTPAEPARFDSADTCALPRCCSMAVSSMVCGYCPAPLSRNGPPSRRRTHRTERYLQNPGYTLDSASRATRRGLAGVVGSAGEFTWGGYAGPILGRPERTRWRLHEPSARPTESLLP